MLNRDPARYARDGYCLLKGVVPSDALPRLRDDILDCIAETKESAWYGRLTTASWPNESGALRIGLLAGFMRPKEAYLPHERQGSYAHLRGGEPRWEPVRWDAAWPFRV